MTDMVDTGSEFIRDLGDAARRNPVSAALIGMGILWLFAGGKAGVGPGALMQRSGMDRIPEAAKDTYNTAREGVAAATNSAAEAIREAGSAGIETATRMGSEYAKILPDSANLLNNMRGNLGELFKAQPLALGAIGLAIGAGIAAALPNTALENSITIHIQMAAVAWYHSAINEDVRGWRIKPSAAPYDYAQEPWYILFVCGFPVRGAETPHAK